MRKFITLAIILSVYLFMTACASSRCFRCSPYSYDPYYYLEYDQFDNIFIHNGLFEDNQAIAQAIGEELSEADQLESIHTSG